MRFVPMDQQARRRFCGQIFSEQCLIESLSLDDSCLDIPTGRSSRASKRQVNEVDDLSVIRFHRSIQ